MIKRRKYIAVISALLWVPLLPLLVFAQPSGIAGSFSRIGFGPRGMGMGNALLATGAEGFYGYYNPALSAQKSQTVQLDFSTALLSFDRSLHTLNASFPLPPYAGINVALVSAGVDGIDGRTSEGYFTGELSTREYQLLTAFGIRLSENISAGIGIKLNLADFHPELSNAKGTAFDIGLLYRLSGGMKIGFVVQDLLASYRWNTSELYGGESSGVNTERFPLRYGLGVSQNITPELLLAARYGLLTHDGLRFHQLKIGSSWRLHEHLSLRAGWQIDDLERLRTSNRPGAGFSINLPFDSLSPSVDYAFLMEPNQISSMHVFGLKLNL